MIGLNYLINSNVACGEEIRIYPLGDIHVGSVGFEGLGKELLLETVDKIKRDRNAYWIGMGDLLECINPSDKRWDEQQIARYFKDRYSNLADEQARVVEQMLRPIRHKGIGNLAGNHEEALRLTYHNDIHQILCRDLGVPNLGNAAFVRLSFKRKNSCQAACVTLFSTHGHGGGSLPGGSINNAYKMMNSFEADIYLMGHVHRVGSIPGEIMKTKGDSKHQSYIHRSKGLKGLICKPLEIQAKLKRFVLTGSWMSGYPESSLGRQVTTYVERKLLPPASLGCPIIHITPFKSKSGGKNLEMEYHVTV